MDRELYEQQQDYLDNVVRAEVEERPLVSARMSTSALSAEFAEGVFAAKVASLRRRYEAAVFLRRDGNCFVRAFVTGLLLHLRKTDATERARLTELFRGSLEYACSQGGYEQFILEDFHDVLMERVEAAGAEGASEESVLEQMRTAELSDYCVMFMRCLVGAVMMQRQEQYLSFLPDVARMRDYVKSEIEPMGRESEETSIMALADYTSLTIRVEYLDLSVPQGCKPGDSEMPMNSHFFPLGASDDKVAMVLLYRPGHFDLLL